MTPAAPGPRHIAVIAFDGGQSLDIVGPMEVFSVANLLHAGGLPPYTVTLASRQGGEVATHGGLRLAGAVALAALPDDIDTLVLTGGSETALREAVGPGGIVPWLTERATCTRRVASVCTGAFVLAGAGLLDGKRATTHWNRCALLQSLCPAVRVEPDAIFVAEPPFYTSAGVTAGIDLCLALVEADAGPELARAVARDLVLFMRRPGGQSQFSTGVDVQAHAAPRLSKLLTDIIESPTGDLRGPALAERAGMSERSFSRLFRQATGLTPTHFVELARVDRAKALLESSDWPLARVADRAGFGSTDALHRAFIRRVGITPGAFRERFGRLPASMLPGRPVARG